MGASVPLNRIGKREPARPRARAWERLREVLGVPARWLCPRSGPPSHPLARGSRGPVADHGSNLPEPCLGPALPGLVATPGRAPPPVPAARLRPTRAEHAGAEHPPRLEWLRVDACEDLDFCRLTVIITCSCTRCRPDVPVFIFWSDGKASVELSWSEKHSCAKAVLSGEWFMAAGGARGLGSESRSARQVRRRAGRARLLSAAPCGHRVRGPREGCGRLLLAPPPRPGSAPSRPRRGPPPPDWIHRPCPAPPPRERAPRGHPPVLRPFPSALPPRRAPLSSCCLLMVQTCAHLGNQGDFPLGKMSFS